MAHSRKEKIRSSCTEMTKAYNELNRKPSIFSAAIVLMKESGLSIINEFAKQSPDVPLNLSFTSVQNHYNMIKEDDPVILIPSVDNYYRGSPDVASMDDLLYEIKEGLFENELRRILMDEYYVSFFKERYNFDTFFSLEIRDRVITLRDVGIDER